MVATIAPVVKSRFHRTTPLSVVSLRIVTLRQSETGTTNFETSNHQFQRSRTSFDLEYPDTVQRLPKLILQRRCTYVSAKSFNFLSLLSSNICCCFLIKCLLFTEELEEIVLSERYRSVIIVLRRFEMRA